MLSLVSVGTGVICTRAGSLEPMVKLSVIFPSLSSPLTDRLSLVLLVLSVTAMVQLSYVPSSRAMNVIVVILSASVVVLLSLLLQLPPYVMAPASVE